VVSLGHVNNVLVIVFASEFFGPFETTLPALYIFPFFALIIPIRLYQTLLRPSRP
jgi:BASS family bile acid:Na+ symporter